jgi:dihydroorotate dehydrogenase
MIKFISAPFGNYIKTKETISVTGSWTVQKRNGRIKQIVKTLRYTKRGWVNKIGLRNPGLEYGLKHHKDNEVMSLAGINPNDWNIFSEQIPSNFDLEINLSCPNIESHETSGIENFESENRKWFIGKISPLTTNEELDEYIEKFKFKQIHACNTLPIDRGGLSGRELIPYTEKFIKYIKKHYPSVEIIAGGGIQSKKDIENYLNLGADHISLGTICFNPLNLRKLL